MSRSAVPVAGSDWIGNRQTDATVLTGVNRIPLFYGFLGLCDIAGLFGLLALIGLPSRPGSGKVGDGQPFRMREPVA